MNTEEQRYQGRRHTHDETSRRASLTVSASHSRSSVGSSSLSPDPEKHLMEDILDDIFTEVIPKVKDVDKDDHRPSFAEMQSEYRMRRPSVTLYQLEDSDHPDIKSIQDLVAGMTFGESIAE